MPTVTLIKVIVFVVASGGIAWISRASLADVRSHGFYRFFAWEAMLALLLLNIGYWFDKPFCLRQLISWLLLFASIPLAVGGFRALHRADKSNHDRTDPALLDFEKTTELVTTGAYRYIRHPLYGSLLFLAWGIFFKQPTLIGAGLVLLATLCLIATAKNDETENRRFFGPAYQDYMRRTKMFIPFIF